VIFTGSIPGAAGCSQKQPLGIQGGIGYV
jgi:hypothetical protein